MIIRLLVVAGAVLLSSGCGNESARDVTDVASRFHQAVQAKDFATACGLLSEQVRQSLGDCPKGLQATQLELPRGTAHAQVFGQNGIVRWRGEAVFVSRFPQGWKVIAAGCTPRPGKPYDCSVSGG